MNRRHETPFNKKKKKRDVRTVAKEMSFFNHDVHLAIRKEREKRTIGREVAALASLANKEEGTELLTSNLPSVFRLFFRSPQSCLIYTGYITVIFRESHSIISLSLLVRLFYLARLPCHPTLFPLPPRGRSHFEVLRQSRTIHYISCIIISPPRKLPRG